MDTLTTREINGTQSADSGNSGAANAMTYTLVGVGGVLSVLLFVIVGFLCQKSHSFCTRVEARTNASKRRSTAHSTQSSSAAEAARGANDDKRRGTAHSALSSSAEAGGTTACGTGEGGGRSAVPVGRRTPESESQSTDHRDGPKPAAEKQETSDGRPEKSPSPLYGVNCQVSLDKLAYEREKVKVLMNLSGRSIAAIDVPERPTVNVLAERGSVSTTSISLENFKKRMSNLSNLDMQSVGPANSSARFLVQTFNPKFSRTFSATRSNSSDGKPRDGEALKGRDSPAGAATPKRIPSGRWSPVATKYPRSLSPTQDLPPGPLLPRELMQKLTTGLLEVLAQKGSEALRDLQCAQPSDSERLNRVGGETTGRVSSKTDKPLDVTVEEPSEHA